MFREPLLQSSLWQAFQEKNGRTCFTGSFGLAIIETLPLVGKYCYCPRGPLKETHKVKEELLKGVSDHQAHWIRIEPGSEEALLKLREVFDEYTIVPAPHTVQPREILLMDIRPSEAELLAKMKPKTRYNVRLAERHGVKIRFSRRTEDMEQFIECIYATTNRKAIRPHLKKYYRNFFTVFSKEQCIVAIAEHEGKVLAANLLVFFEDTAYYLHGGSSDVGRHVMAPFLLQWKSIEEAKKRGMYQYNFGGVSLQGKNMNEAWAGITRFKQGFTPTTPLITFPGAYDIIVSPFSYRLYRCLRLLQTIVKHFRP